MFFMCVLGALDTDYPRDADCVGGAYFPRRKARREVPPPPSNKFTFFATFTFCFEIVENMNS